ncbi:MAG TPA: hypothetical protein VMZ32_02840 [Gammaproteobacteria bacterium]|nr:hypothetical protein [Gammaproteobacteria bacterium]
MQHFIEDDTNHPLQKNDANPVIEKRAVPNAFLLRPPIFSL